MIDLIEKYAPNYDAEGGGDGGGDGGTVYSPEGMPDEFRGETNEATIDKLFAARSQPGAPYIPEGLPEQFHGDSDPRTIDNLAKAYAGAREKLNTIPQPGKTVDDYSLELSEDLSKSVGDLTKDPLVDGLRELALENTMVPDQYSKFMGGAIGLMEKLGAFAPNATDEQIVDGLIKADLQGTAREEAIVEATKSMTDARSWVDNLAGGEYSDFEKSELALMTQSTGGLALINKLMAGPGGSSITPGDNALDTKSLAEQIEARRKDPRNMMGDAKYDAEFKRETTEMYKKLHATR